MDLKLLGIAVALFAVGSLLFSAPLADAAGGEGDDPEPPSIEYLHGFIYEIPAQMDRIPIEGVTVTTWTTVGMFGQTTTDDKGEFTVKYSENVKYISFVLEEYTVQGWCSDLVETANTGMFEVDLKSESETGGVHDLFDDAGYSAIISRTIGTIFGTVTAIVGNDTISVSGATVTVTSSSTVLSTDTDDTGYFMISCPRGTFYDLKVSASGFVTLEEGEVVPSDLAHNLRLVEKDHDMIFGLDLTHMLELLGLLIFLLVAILAVYLIRRPTTADSLAVINDLPVVKIEDELEKEDEN